MAIQEIPIRAEIYSGGSLLVRTPYIQSFNVTRSRGVPATFSATVKILPEDFEKINTNIVIYAGEKNNLDKIFTGYLKKARPQPCWNDPSYIIVTMEGKDILGELEDKKFTRRQTYSINAWGKIDSVVRQGPKSGKFQYIKEPSLSVSNGTYAQSSSTYIPTAPSDVSVTSPSSHQTDRNYGLKVTAQPIVE